MPTYYYKTIIVASLMSIVSLQVFMTFFSNITSIIISLAIVNLVFFYKILYITLNLNETMRLAEKENLLMEESIENRYAVKEYVSTLKFKKLLFIYLISPLYIRSVIRWQNKIIRLAVSDVEMKNSENQ